MPIRFRCAYCNQLLGISRRKSGTVVRCPTCAGQVVVPNMDEEGAADDKNEKEAPAPAPESGGGQRFFEGSEIDKLLEGAAGDQPSALGSVGRETIRPAMLPGKGAPPPPSKGAPPPPVHEPVPLMIPAPATGPAVLPGARPPGIWLSPARATLLSVLAVIALAVSFGVGLLVGLFIGHR